MDNEMQIEVNGQKDPVRNVRHFLDDADGGFERAIERCDYATVEQMLVTGVVSPSYMDYDGAGIAQLAVETRNVEFADKVMTLLEEKCGGEGFFADEDGCTPIGIARQVGHAMVRMMVEKHGYAPGDVFRRVSPAPWSIYAGDEDEPAEVEGRFRARWTVVGAVEELAYVHHFYQTRKDGVTPYFAHPNAVYEFLKPLPEVAGFDRVLMLAVAWGHDLLEDTDISDVEIVGIDGELGPMILDGIRQLTFLRHGEPEPACKAERKGEYIARVAREASPEILAVKVADRICNARDFLKLEGAGPDKAASYLAEGEPLRLALKRLPPEICDVLTEKWRELANLCFSLVNRSPRSCVNMDVLEDNA